MIDKFLRAKHWQIFLLTAGIPVIFQIILMSYLFSSMNQQGELDREVFFIFMKFFPPLMIIFTGIIFGWLWSIAIGLQKKIPENIPMKVGKFKTLFFIPLIYISLIMTFVLTMSPAILGMMVSSGIVIFILLIHLFSMFCIFYTLYFVAKTFKTAELQREVSFSEFAGEFFMFWFFPIGVWILQPKINAMMEEEDEFL